MARSLTRWTILALATAAASTASAQDVKKDIPGASPAEFKPYTEQVPRYLVRIEMLPVTGGKATVTLGIDKKPVEIKDFWMAKCEVPWDAFNVFRHSKDLTPEERDADNSRKHHLRSRPSFPVDNPDRGFGQDQQPALSVAFNAARVYCEYLTKHTGRKYRLPTEAEFEYAARAGRDVVPADALKEEAWSRETSPTEAWVDGAPRPVGTSLANPWGFHDLLGNVAEWTLSVEEGKPPILRGGSYKTASKVLSPAFRQPYSAKWQERDCQDPKSVWWLSDGDFVGFRVVREREDGK
jgi:formylglycine-generating enzyme required for sulfatase activity